jgi:hypothetical protein
MQGRFHIIWTMRADALAKVGPEIRAIELDANGAPIEHREYRATKRSAFANARDLCQIANVRVIDTLHGETFHTFHA